MSLRLREVCCTDLPHLEGLFSAPVHILRLVHGTKHCAMKTQVSLARLGAGFGSVILQPLR